MEEVHLICNHFEQMQHCTDLPLHVRFWNKIVERGVVVALPLPLVYFDILVFNLVDQAMSSVHKKLCNLGRLRCLVREASSLL